MRISLLLLLLTLTIGFLLFATPQAGGVAAQDGSQVVVESRFDVTDAPSQTEIVQQVVDFPSGAWTSPHSHGGQAINLVLEGEITLRQGGVDKAHTAGQSWTDSTGQVHAAGNTGNGLARLLTNFILPSNATQTTVEGTSDNQPTVTYEARFPLPALPATTEIRQQAISLQPGWQESTAYAGFTSSLMIDGEVSFTVSGSEQTYQAGEAWSTRGSVPVEGSNKSGREARVFTTYLLPKGADLNVTPGPVDPGSNPTASSGAGENGWLMPVLVAVLFAIAAVAVGIPLMRRERSR
jgi:quercetin dioxygenase-like cupin family protein